MTPKLARIMAPDVLEHHGADVPLPEEIANAKGLHILDHLETLPTVAFDDVGDYMRGRFAESRVIPISSGSGVRQQTMYDLVTDSGVKISVWGSTILDRRMVEAAAGGMRAGASVIIQYLGTIKTDQPSPAKNFRVVWR